MLRGSFLFLVAFIAATIATPSLILEVSGPSTVNSVDKFSITTAVKNSGAVAVRLLNNPRGPLSDLPTDMFAITNRHGFSPEFVGISVKYSASTALASEDYHAYTDLAPGQSVSVQHDMSDAYDFSASGPGQYIVTMKSFNTFYYVVDGKVSVLVGSKSQPFHTINIVGDARSHKNRPHRHSGEHCEAWQKRAIDAAIPLAEKYVRHAVEALKKSGREGVEYKRWFGPAQNGNMHASVSGRFEALVGNNFTAYTYECNADLCENRPGLIGYVHFNKIGTIHLCKQFFEAEVGGHNSRASTIVHEALHFVKNGDVVDEHMHSETLGLELAQNYPLLAAANTDNYEYFAVAAAGEGDVSVLLTEVHFGKQISDL